MRLKIEAAVVFPFTGGWIGNSWSAVPVPRSQLTCRSALLSFFLGCPLAGPVARAAVAPIAQIRSLSRDQADRGLPVEIRGVITWRAPNNVLNNRDVRYYTTVQRPPGGDVTNPGRVATLAGYGYTVPRNYSFTVTLHY